MTEDELKAVKVGDTVFVHLGYRNQIVEDKAIKVGPKLVHTEHNGAFRRDTGLRASGYAGHFETAAQQKAHVRRDEAQRRLRALSVEIRLGFSNEWSADELVALADAAEAIKNLTSEAQSGS